MTGKAALILTVLILAGMTVAEATLSTPKHKPMKVRCKQHSPCFNKQMYCPSSCPRSCSVDCDKCQTVCAPGSMIPPPNPKIQKPKKVQCKDKRFRACYNKPLFCPAACPLTCTVNCATCKPVCGVVNPPVSSTPKRVRCMDKNYPACYYREFTCPAACPQTCQVDSVTCSPVCSKCISFSLIFLSLVVAHYEINVRQSPREPTRVDTHMGHPWARAHKPTGNEC